MKIKGIGSDVVEINRIREKINRIAFIERVFTKTEISYCSQQAKPEEHFAARFAAKEAYMKALGEGWGNNSDFKDIEVNRNDKGAPYIRLYNEALKHFENLMLKHIFVSLSHTDKTAISFVVIEMD